MNRLSLPSPYRSLSVFRDVDTFTQFNPIIKAPTLVCDDGEILMDSTLILAYLQKLANAQAAENQLDQLPSSDQHPSLMPTALHQYQKALHLIGLGLNACDKSVQIVYERELRPAEKQHQPWFTRVQSHLLAAYDLIEAEIANESGWLVYSHLTDADITISVAWQFTQYIIPDVVSSHRYPAISAFSARAEALSEFTANPMDPNWQAKT